MDKIKKIVLCNIPMSICNLRCRYCYLAQRDESFQGEQVHIKYSPEYIAKVFSKKRFGGTCYFNFCAAGETLLTKEIDEYIYAIVKEGHYAEIVSNMTVTPIINKILTWEPEILARVSFKCSFHYLQLLERGLLQTFAENVKNVWAHNCSANVEITPDDELIPHIDDVKKFSIENFGALPHLSIARDDRTGHDYLTKLSMEEYDRIWSQFDSGFWRFKRSIFNVKREEYCYAGAWSMYVNFVSGIAVQCYCGSKYTQNIYKNVNKPIKEIAIEKCGDTHCYNGHALLTLGLIPGFTDVGYGDIRDRERADGTHWLQPQLKAFFNSKLEESNPQFTEKEKKINGRFLKKCKSKAKLKGMVKKIIKR